MSCATIMTKDPLFVRADDSVAQATEKLLAHRVFSLPVVDAEGRYAGMFGVYDLLSLLVPRVALAGNLLPNLRFLGDDPGELGARYAELKTCRVGDVADKGAAALRPDTAEIEAIRLFCQSHGPLAVVDPDSRKVVGTVSCWDAVGAIAAARMP